MRRLVCLLALVSLGADAPPSLRLPAGVRPLRCALELRVVPSEPTFSGSARIEADWLIGAVGPTFCDPAHRREIASFLGPRVQRHAGGAHALEDGLAAAQACEAAHERKRAAIDAFLAGRLAGR